MEFMEIVMPAPFIFCMLRPRRPTSNALDKVLPRVARIYVALARFFSIAQFMTCPARAICKVLHIY
jgi:hypothetical protein